MDRVGRKSFSLSTNKDCGRCRASATPEKVMEVIMAAADERLS
jgi:hypothetical protein